MSEKDFDLDNTFELTPNDLVTPEERRAKGATLPPDPITGRWICIDCWNGRHGTIHKPCKDRGCCCGCKDGIEEQRRQRSAHGAARRERKALEREQLESPENPLCAFQSRARETWVNEHREESDAQPEIEQLAG
jgi:hypothetical protein